MPRLLFQASRRSITSGFDIEATVPAVLSGWLVVLLLTACREATGVTGRLFSFNPELIPFEDVIANINIDH